MPQAAKTLLFISLLPLLLAVGHDIYLNYFSNVQKIEDVTNLEISPDSFMMSDLGWVWGNYSPGTLEMIQNSVSANIWSSHINPILQKTTIMVASAPFFAGIAFLVLTLVIGVWPFKRYSKNSHKHSSNQGVYKNAKENKVKYKK